MARDAALRISRLQHPITTLGPGRRVGLWLQGCTIGCRGCVSRDTWDPEGGIEVEVTVLAQEIIDRAADGDLDGITISGGEPFQQPVALEALASLIRHDLPDDADVLVYSGMPWSTLERDHSPILALVDAVASEPYLDGSPPTTAWVGSANQVIHPTTDLGRARYTVVPPAGTELQVSVDDGAIWLTGIPRRGDLDRFEDGLRARGIEIGALSWRS